MGGYLVNYFNRFGRQWQVYVEAEGDYRTNIKDLGRFYVAQRERRDGAADRGDSTKSIAGPGVHDALQRIPRRADQCVGRARV